MKKLLNSNPGFLKIDIDKIVVILEEEYCAFHHEKAAVRVKSGRICLTTCCDDFQEKLERIINEEVCRQAEELTDN